MYIKEAPGIVEGREPTENGTGGFDGGKTGLRGLKAKMNGS